MKTRWQTRQNELQLLANEKPSEAQSQSEQAEFDFRQEYDTMKDNAARERTRLNEIHEQKLDSILDIAKKETNQKLNTVWNETPLKVRFFLSDSILHHHHHRSRRSRIGEDTKGRMSACLVDNRIRPLEMMKKKNGL